MKKIDTRHQIRLNMAITETEKEKSSKLRSRKGFIDDVKRRYDLYTECFTEVFGKDAEE